MIDLLLLALLAAVFAAAALYVRFCDSRAAPRGRSADEAP